MKWLRSGKIFFSRALMLVEHCRRNMLSDKAIESAATQAYLNGASQTEALRKPRWRTLSKAYQPPAIAPTIRNGSAPVATASGNAASGDS